MKLKTQVCLLTVVTLLLAGVIGYAERARPREINLPVQGMVCEGCEEHLREKLLEAPGVRSVLPSHKDQQVTIVVAGWAHAEAPELREIIERAGYDTAGVE